MVPTRNMKQNPDYVLYLKSWGQYFLMKITSFAHESRDIFNLYYT